MPWSRPTAALIPTKSRCFSRACRTTLPTAATNYTGMADAMDSVEMISILSGMSEGHKRYVAGYLASIMISDNNIDEMEMRLWRLVSDLCAFPTMTIREAVEFWSEN